MVKSETKDDCPKKWKMVNRGGGGGGAFYGLGFLGALIYFLQNATSFVDVIFAIFKAIIWPALFTYRLLEFLKI